MASIRKRGDRYKVRWRDTSGVQRERTCPDRTTARRLKSEVERSLALGLDWQPAARTVRASTFESVLSAYITRVRQTRALNTTRGVVVALGSFLSFLDTSGIGRQASIRQLDRSLVFEWLGTLGHLSERSRFNYAARVAKAWEWAADSDEFGDITPRARKVEVRQPAVVRREAPTWSQLDLVVRATRSEWQRRSLVLMRYTGLRVEHQAGELRWSDVDLERAELRIRPELGKTRQERSGRVIPISPHLATELAGWGQREGLLIGHDGIRANYNTIRDAWKDSGLSVNLWKNRPHHAFRAAFMTGLKRLGADDEAVKYLVGHSAGVRDHYIDPWQLPLRETVALIPKITNVGRMVIMTPDTKIKSNNSGRF